PVEAGEHAATSFPLTHGYPARFDRGIRKQSMAAPEILMESAVSFFQPHWADLLFAPAFAVWRSGFILHFLSLFLLKED
ncbi:MAG: hypothetical protein PUD63_04910, partial [Clostridia bacterium]|nr:hypothetical protein [Clostridia bacterium]